MDKYEYSLKLDQLKALCLEGKYEEAAEIADSINWNKVKNVNALVKAGEIYEKVERYEDSREILLSAYDRSPIGRTIIYRLAEVAIAMGDYEGAQEYYDEFVDIAPNDNQRYVLRYNIRKAQNATLQELVSILEEFKEQEYTEEWAFELAYLYHKSGQIEKCIDACDELILWFGDGPYVERALELKMLYQPLTKIQEEKYRRFRHEKEGKTVIGAEEMVRAGEYVHEAVAIPQITLNPSRFNTTNLQEEIAKGMQQIMEATEKETVVGTMDNIKKIVEDIPYINLPVEEPIEEDTAHIETDEEIDGALKINFQELLGEDYDGQMSLVVNEKARLEQQITGQMTIAEILEEWEKTKRAAEVALKDAEQRKLDSAKARALQEAEGIMERLNTVLPKLEAGVTPQEMMDEQYLQKANAILDEEIERLSTENERLAAEIAAEVRLGQTIRIEEDELDQIKAAVADLTQGEEPVALPEMDINLEVTPIEEIVEEEALESVDAVEAPVEEIKEEVTAPVETVKEEKPDGLTEEQKAVFSYFVPVRGMEKQLCDALTGIMEHEKTHLVIQGSEGCGKTMLATSIIRALQKEYGRPNGRVGKIYAEALNKKDIQQLLKKIAGGCLIIEKVGEISRQTAVALSLLLEQDTSGILVIIEDTAAGIEKALSVDDSFAKRFTQKITVPLFKIDDLVTFANSYANELGYVIDEMAILALHNKITTIEKLNQATKLEEIKEIIDAAIYREGHSGLRKFMGILTANRYTDDEKIVLTEKDFK